MITTIHSQHSDTRLNLKEHIVRMKWTHLNILNSWSISESPWNSGFFVTISAKMQPTLHMSTGQEQRCEPRRTSGARYHNVTTFGEGGRKGLRQGQGLGGRLITSLYPAQNILSYLMCVSSDWNSECSTEAKVSQLDGSFLIDEQILWFEIAMQNTS